MIPTSIGKPPILVHKGALVKEEDENKDGNADSLVPACTQI